MESGPSRPPVPRLGALRALVEAIRAGDGVWVHPDWELRDEAGLRAMVAGGGDSPAIAYAPWQWTTGGRENPPRPELDALLARPFPLGVIAWRAAALRGIAWPDTGADDLILDAAADWAVAVMALARGVSIGVAPAPASTRMAILPEHPDRLREDGKRWLREQALRWNATIGVGSPA